MEEKIYVKNAITKDDYDLIANYGSESIVFCDNYKRLMSSNVKTIIYQNECPIGFLNLVDERVQGTLFMDIFILPEYRNRGYASLAYIELEKNYTGNEFIIAQTKKDNVDANGSLLKNGIIVASTDDMNFYLMNKSREEEFLNSDSYDSFVSHFGLNSNKVYIKK